jgi:hypothetical protein
MKPPVTTAPSAAVAPTTVLPRTVGGLSGARRCAERPQSSAGIAAISEVASNDATPNACSDFARRASGDGMYAETVPRPPGER